jgi:hypothetical protein
MSLVISQITSPCVWSIGLRVGDIFESISDVVLDNMKPQEAMSVLMSADLPSVLRFSCGSSLSCHEAFEIVLDESKLGVTFVGDGPENIPVINRFVDRSYGSYGSEQLCLGDVLVSVNEIDTITLGLDKMIELISRTTRPITLGFHRISQTLRNEPFPDTTVRRMGPERGSSFSTLFSPVGRRCSSSAYSNLFHSNVETTRQSRSSSLTPDTKPLPWNDKTTRGDILIVWREGPLGMTLVEDSITGHTCVNRLTGKGTSIGVDRLHHGDQLLSINGIKTEGHGFRGICKLLSHSEKPILLLFKPSRHRPRVHSDGAPVGNRKSLQDVFYTRSWNDSSSILYEEYEVLWSRGLLGLILGFEEDQEEPFIRMIKSNCTLKFPPIAGGVGDTLVAVNYIKTSAMDPDHLLLMLQAAIKPVVLRFRTQKNRKSLNRINRASCYVIQDFYFIEDNQNDALYQLIWSGAKKLGLIFGHYYVDGYDKKPNKQMVIYVKSIASSNQELHRVVQVGDQLVSVNTKSICDVSVAGDKFLAIMQNLANAPKPIVLGFHRHETLICAHTEDEVDDNDEEEDDLFLGYDVETEESRVTSEDQLHRDDTSEIEEQE